MGEVGYKTLAIDIETFSDVDLIKCGVYAYADSPAFEILLFAYSFDDDGTLTLKVQAVFPYRGVSKAYIHEVTVRDTKDGGIQYVGNRIIEPINNPEIRWHVPRLTRTEWEELYGDN